jgi:toxin ParE1/3/4
MGSADYRLLWSPEAEDDLLSIWHYGAARWSAEAADAHLFLIEAACDRLCYDPLLGRARPELLVEIRSISVRPHVVFYQVSKRAVEIVRVLHEHMDVEHVFADPAE